MSKQYPLTVFLESPTADAFSGSPASRKESIDTLNTEDNYKQKRDKTIGNNIQLIKESMDTLVLFGNTALNMGNNMVNVVVTVRARRIMSLPIPCNNMGNVVVTVRARQIMSWPIPCPMHV